MELRPRYIFTDYEKEQIDRINEILKGLDAEYLARREPFVQQLTAIHAHARVEYDLLYPTEKAVSDG